MKDQKTGNFAAKVDAEALAQFKAIADLQGVKYETAATEALWLWVEQHREAALRRLAATSTSNEKRTVHRKAG